MKQGVRRKKVSEEEEKAMWEAALGEEEEEGKWKEAFGDGSKEGLRATLVRKDIIPNCAKLRSI